MAAQDETAITQTALQARLDALQAQRSEVAGFAIAVIDGDRVISAASGKADPEGTPMTAQTPFRLASVTKTFVAASILRLVEEERLDLDIPIATFISGTHSQMLSADGYNPRAITIRHLLMHSGGLHDHFGTQEGIAVAFANPQREWTRTEQLALMTKLTDPVGQPGEKFHYSDTGYILLGEIIEAVTREPLPKAVRELNRFDDLEIEALRWEALNGEAEQGATRAHQWIDGFDIFEMSGSLDAFGGGGLIGNVIDTARYFDGLFSGDVLASQATLDLMIEAPGHPDGSPYRLGLFTDQIGDKTAYMHGGFWGVHAMHVPALDLTIVCVALDEAGERDIRKLAYDLISEQ